MNRFWKRQLPAFFLTLVMLASLAPAALAVPSATDGGSCSPGYTHNWGSGVVTAAATCSKTGVRVYTCEHCRKTVTETIPVDSNSHNFKTIGNTAGVLVRQCEDCGKVETGNSSTTNQGRNFTISVGTTSGKYVGTDIRNQVSTLFRALTGYTGFSAIYFSGTGGYGNIYHNNSRDSLWNSYSYNELSNSVFFIPSSAGSFSLTYTAEDSSRNQISGVITLTGAPITTNTTDIVLRVAPGGTVNLRSSRFEEAYKKLSSDSGALRSVSLIVDSRDYANFDGSFYSGSRTLSQDDLDRYDFYTDDSSQGHYSLDTLNFKATSRADIGDQLVMTVRYRDRYTSYEGTLRILIDKEGKQEDEVLYRVAPGSSVTFNRSDFNQVYQNLTSTTRTISYVEFDPGDDYTHFTGDIRASGHAAYSKKGLSEEWFYYSTDRRDSYGIDDLIFQAGTGAKEGDTLEIPFRACYDRDDSVQGVLRIVIDKDGSRDTVTLNVAPGSTARLDKTAFNRV